MYDFLRVTSAVPEVAVADTDKNTQNIISFMERADGSRADIVVFPELCVTGYTCADLFFQSALTNGAVKSLGKITDESKKLSCVVTIGLPLEIDGLIYNCAAVIYKGRICGIVPKTFIPSYNEFYEKRWFASSADLQRSEISSFEIGIDENNPYSIPVGRDIVFDMGGRIKFGVEICEDLWAPIPPSTFLAFGGAEVLINISASNETIAKRKYRSDLVCQQSARTLSCYVYTSAGCAESTTDLVFSGHSLFAENGTVVLENSRGVDSDYILTADLDVGKAKADRKKITTFRDSATLYGSMQSIRRVYIPCGELKGNAEFAKISKHPFVPAVKKDRADRCMQIFEMQVAGLKKRLGVTGLKPVVGVSGGLDSTLALLVSVKAAKELGRDAKDVFGITMPCFGTSDRTHDNSLKLMKLLGISCEEINIKSACMKHFEDINQNPDEHDVTYENVQARERTQVLMDFAGKNGGLVVGTGDLSELALGWCTYNADHMSMYGVNASIPKTLVKWMIESICEYSIFPDCTKVLEDIAATPISPELIPPDENGKIIQKTESIVGPYELHDFYLYNILRYGFEPKKIYYLACTAFKDDYGKDEILKWLKNFYRRFFTQQFKRSCLPDGVKVGSACLSPRGDWRMPSDASFACWIKETEDL